MADGRTGTGDSEGDDATRGSPRRQSLLIFVAFLFLFGQPVVVFALAVESPSLAALAVIAVGTALLAGPTARAFVRDGRSLSRLADFVLALAAVQVLLLALSQLAVAATSADVMAAFARPVIVVAAYPIAYYAIYRGGLGSDRDA